MQRFKKELFKRYGSLNMGRYNARGEFLGYARIAPAQVPMTADVCGKFDYRQAVHMRNFTVGQTRCFQFITLDYVRNWDGSKTALKDLFRGYQRALAAHGWKLP